MIRREIRGDLHETEYFLALLELARAGSLKYRKRMESKIAGLKRENEDLSKRLQRGQLEPGEKELTYYSAWYWSAIHILVSIPEFQTSKAIARKLQLPETLVHSTLESLLNYGLVRREQNRWHYGQGELHVPRTSLLVGLHHHNWRQRAVLDAQEQSSNGIHYTVVQSMSRAAFEQIKELMLRLVEDSAKLAGPSKEEELVCLTCDLFQP